MKIRQALKICDSLTTRNVIMVQKGNAFVVVGIKNTPYTFRQFCKAARVIKKAYKRHYNGKDTRFRIGQKVRDIQTGWEMIVTTVGVLNLDMDSPYIYCDFEGNEGDVFEYEPDELEIIEPARKLIDSEKAKDWLKHNIVKYTGMFTEHFEDEDGRETIKVCPCVDAALYDDFEKAMEE